MGRTQAWVGLGAVALSAVAWAGEPDGKGGAEAPKVSPAPSGSASASPKAPPAPSGSASAAPASKPPKCKPGMVGIPAGRFTMGDAENTDKAGEVTVAAFCMDRTEVTVAAYAACVKTGKCNATDTDADFVDWHCNGGVAAAKHPINCVDWSQATAYCEAQGLRLPTEEEWEYAARGPDGRKYPWGNAAPAKQLCWNRGSFENCPPKACDEHRGGKGTCAVGSYPAGRSPFGLDDMAGNVSEWTASSNTDESQDLRVIRGGGWDDGAPSVVRSAYRGGSGPANRSDLLGFRCAGAPLP